MDGKKVYQIQINGITESVNAVEALNKQLDALNARIKALENSNVRVNATSRGGGSNASALSEEAAIQKEINKLKQEGATLDAKIVAVQDEIYKRVDATKQLYKEAVADQKALAAQERLVADTYSNTMNGIKEKLADLKSVHFTTDLSSDEFKQQTAEINTLTEKLKELEKEYGVYSRDVGNYANGIKEGFKGLAIQVGDTTQKFDNAKQALKELKKERDTLATKKELGIISEEEAKRLENLIPTVAQLQSAIQDAGKPMDALMDTMQSFVAITQVSKGLGAFFGIDNAEIDKTIKNLVALQNAMQGLQTIQKQIQSREGVGAWIAPFTVGIDKATAKLLTFNTALLGTGKAAKAASVAIKGFGKALKVAFSVGVLVVVDLLAEGLMKLVDSFKKVDDAAKRTKEVQEAAGKAYGDAMAKITQYKSKVDSFTGSKKKEKKIVEELNKELGEGLGTYKSLAQWKEVLKKKTDAYIESMVLEAQQQALLNQLVDLYAKKWNAVKHMKDDFSWTEQIQSFFKGSKSVYDDRRKAINEIDEGIAEIDKKLKANAETINKHNKENGLFDYSPQIKKNATKTKNTIEETQKTLNQLELRLMDEGLNKKLRQLDEEERQTINKLKENGRKTSAEIQKVQKAYAQLRIKEIEEYLRNLEEKIRKSAQDIKNIQFEIDTKDIDIELDRLKNKFDELSKDVPKNNPLTTKVDYNMLLNKMLRDGLKDDLSDYFKIVALQYAEEYKSTTAMLSVSFQERLEATEKYYSETIKALRENIQTQSKLNKQRIDEQYKQDYDAEVERYRLMYNEYEERLKLLNKNIANIDAKNDEEVKKLERLKSDRDKVEKQMEDALRQHGEKEQQLTEAKNNAIKKNEIDTLNEISQVQERYYNQQISNYRDFQSKLNDEISKNPVTSKGWEIVNIKQTRRNYQEIIYASKTTLKAIEKEKERLEKDFKNGLIDKDAYNTTRNSIVDLENDIKNGMAVTYEALRNLVANFVSSIQQYLQEAMNSFNQIMQAVWSYQDNVYEDEQERLDKENELLEKKLDEQQEIVERHKDAIDDIEDELASARGDRRQHLIDQLNAEIAAQRAAAAEEKKIQKQKEANEKKQDELEKQRKKSQYHRDLLQAIVNGAMAVTYAAVNKWPIPAIPMMALAASTTATQIALMASNKPYRYGGQLEGGLVQGKRHTQGGVPVGNTGIEVEGDEMIIRRESTMPNIDLLNYINKSQRKLDLDDFIDFYSSGKSKKVITSMSPRHKYADGGQLPMLANDYNFDDRLLNAFEDYSNRPVVVSVKEILNTSESIRKVETLAGLAPSTI